MGILQEQDCVDVRWPEQLYFLRYDQGGRFGTRSVLSDSTSRQCITCRKSVLDDTRHLWLSKMWHNFRIHSVRFSKMRAYLSIPRRSRHKCRLVSQSQTLEQQGVFESVRVIDDHCFLEKNLMQRKSTKTWPVWLTEHFESFASIQVETSALYITLSHSIRS